MIRGIWLSKKRAYKSTRRMDKWETATGRSEKSSKKKRFWVFGAGSY